MTKARQLADLLDASGDVAVSALDNVPPNTALVDSSDNTVLDTSNGNVSMKGELNFTDAVNGAGDPTNYIDFAANALVIRPQNSDPNYEAGLIVDKDGATRLFHNGVQKLSTESNGAKVNGDITFNTAYDGIYFPDDGLNYFGRIVGDDGTYKGIGIEHNHHISFSTGGTGGASNSTERMRINSNGQLYTTVDGYSGTRADYGVRAWIKYNGQTSTINASGNISSISSGTTGQWYVNFATAMPDTQYTTVGCAESNEVFGGENCVTMSASTTYMVVETFYQNTTPRNCYQTQVIVVR